MPVLVALGAVLSTTLGGLFALRHRDQLHHILGFTAGVILGVVLFDVLPETDGLRASTGLEFRTVMIAMAASFLFFHGMEKWLLVHNAHEHEYAGHHHPQVGLASALALAGHSLRAGIPCGLPFQVDNGVGIAVAIAVIGHDFADGLNTDSLRLARGNT